MNVFRLGALVVLVLVVMVGVTYAAAGAPTDQVRQYTDQVLKLLEDPNVQGADRRAAVRKAAIEIFDVQETAKRALGRHWQARTPAEREEFVQLFADLLERTYINKIDLYRGERLVYTSEAVDGEYATVRAKVVTKRRMTPTSTLRAPMLLTSMRSSSFLPRPRRTRGRRTSAWPRR